MKAQYHPTERIPGNAALRSECLMFMSLDMTDGLRQAIRQTVKIVSMENRHFLRTGDRCLVEFEFVSHPEFIRTDMKLLFREGKTKVCGGLPALVDKSH